jgi:hypothetical protein
MQHANQLTLGVDDLDGSSVVALKEVEQLPRATVRLGHRRTSRSLFPSALRRAA